MAWLASLRIGLTSWRTVQLLFSSCLTRIGALDRDAQKPCVTLPARFVYACAVLMRPMGMPVPMVAMEASKAMGGVLMPRGAQTVVTGHRIGYYRPYEMCRITPVKRSGGDGHHDASGQRLD